MFWNIIVSGFIYLIDQVIFFSNESFEVWVDAINKWTKKQVKSFSSHYTGWFNFAISQPDSRDQPPTLSTFDDLKATWSPWKIKWIWLKRYQRKQCGLH